MLAATQMAQLVAEFESQCLASGTNQIKVDAYACSEYLAEVENKGKAS